MSEADEKAGKEPAATGVQPSPEHGVIIPPGATDSNAEAMLRAVFDRLGGPEGMYQWALKNQSGFYCGIALSLMTPKQLQEHIQASWLLRSLVPGAVELDRLAPPAPGKGN